MEPAQSDAVYQFGSIIFCLRVLICGKVSNVWPTFIAHVKTNFNASMLMKERVKKYDIYSCFLGDLSVIYTFQLKNGV